MEQRRDSSTQARSDSHQCVLEWEEFKIRKLGIRSILEPRLVASIINVLKTIRVREFSASSLLKCLPEIWTERNPAPSVLVRLDLNDVPISRPTVRFRLEECFL